MRNIHPLIYTLGLVIIALIAYLGLTVYEMTLEPLPVLGPGITTEEGRMVSHKVPEFSFTDQSGSDFGSDRLARKIYVANYFFTSCPTICPQMTENLKALQSEILHYRDVHIVSFTVDPKRDDPERLREYALRHEAYLEQWHFLTGSKKDLYSLARNGFFLSATEGDGGPYDFIHSENFVLVDQEGQIRGFYDGTRSASVNQLVVDIQKLRKSKS